MKSDLDSLMQANAVDAILVTGRADHNPAMYYFTGSGHLTIADLIKKRGEMPVLFHGPMEREEALKTGLITRSYSLYPWNDLIKMVNNNRVQAYVLRYQRMLAEAGVTSGRVMLYGMSELGSGYEIFTALQKALPEIVFCGPVEQDLLTQAMATKDATEIARIKNMGKITTEVVGRVAEFLINHSVLDEVLVHSDGTPVTICDVKSRINLWLAELGAENPEGTIFAIGHDAGVPHSSGNPQDYLRLGQTIVFDIYPCEQGGGYFYDFTRTWCLGYAPEPVQALYSQVLKVYNTIMTELQVNTPFPIYQKRTCELFEAMGHPTVQSDPVTEIGYVHSLGHGIGLRVHEKPNSGSQASSTDMLLPGSAITIEPGLYYPEKNMGVRLENSVWVRPDGGFEVLADYPLDLVLPMKK